MHALSGCSLCFPNEEWQHTSHCKAVLFQYASNMTISDMEFNPDVDGLTYKCYNSVYLKFDYLHIESFID